VSRIRVRALYTRYAHFGPYAGFHQVFRHLSTPHIAVDATPVRDGTLIDAALQVVSRVPRRSWYKSADLAAELTLAFGALTNRFDIVHYLDGEHSLGFFPRFARARRSAARIIGTFHQPPEMLQGLVSRDAVAALDLVMVMSPTQEAFFRNWLPPERVRTFLHGVETDFFRPAAAASPRSTFRCVTVGHWLRDWPAIGAVMDRLRTDTTMEFHIVTNRETGLEGRDRIVMHRRVSDEELLRLYQTSDLLLLPLTSATANNSLLEGLACGLPIVSTDTPAVRAYVGEGTAALVAGNRPDALADAIVAIREDGDRRAEMGRAARARAETLSWPKRTAALVEIYEELALREQTNSAAS
jgi:glycosyltransferase involved in cell wall biosynthesis